MASGTPTTNLGLRTMTDADSVDAQDINYNSGILDTKIGAVGSESLQSQVNTLDSKMTIDLGAVTGANLDGFVANASLAYIALNYKDKPHPIRVVWTNHDNYQGTMLATTNWVKFSLSTTNDLIYGNYAISSGTVTVASINANISGVDTKRSMILNNTNVTSDTFILGLDNGAYQVASSTDITAYLPYNYGTLYVAKSSNNYGMYLFESTVGTYFIRHKATASTWSRGWQQLALKSDLEKLQYGINALDTNIGVGETITKTYNFPNPYSTNSVVIPQVVWYGVPDALHWQLLATTVNGFTIRIKNDHTAAIPASDISIRWIAFGN